MTNGIVTSDHNQHSPFNVPVSRQERSTKLNPARSYLLSLQSERSRITMASYLNQIAKHLNKRDMDSCPWQHLNEDYVRYVLDRLTKENKAPATINTYLSAIKGVCRVAWKQKLMHVEDYMEVKDLKSISGSRLKDGRVIEDTELRFLIDSCKRSSNIIKGIRDAAIFSLLRGCGFRRSELVSINVTDNIDYDNQVIRIVGKNNKERAVPYGDSVKRALEDWLNVRDAVTIDTEALFSTVHRSGKILNSRLSDCTIFDICRDRVREFSMEKIRPHDFRKTYITKLLDDGNPIEDVQFLVGHASSATTKGYDLNKNRNAIRIGRSIQF